MPSRLPLRFITFAASCAPADGIYCCLYGALLRLHHFAHMPSMLEMRFPQECVLLQPIRGMPFSTLQLHSSQSHLEAEVSGEQDLEDGTYHEDDEEAGSLEVKLGFLRAVSWSTMHGLNLGDNDYSPVLLLDVDLSGESPIRAGGACMTLSLELLQARPCSGRAYAEVLEVLKAESA